MDIDKETVQLRRDLARNEKLALEISQVLSKYQFDVPGDTIVVWGPQIVVKPGDIMEARHLLINGIPAPEYLKAAFRFNEQFRI